MKKVLIFMFMVVLTATAFAQDEATTEEGPKDGWSKEGNISLLFSQAAFNNDWTGGGTSNYAANLNLSYTANYKSGDWSWDNRLLVDYGISKTKDQEFDRKTSDRFEINSILGKQISESHWYYSYFLNFKTQMTSGYVYGTDTDGSETRTEATKIFSPAYLQTGPGMLWKKNDNLFVNISPATAKLIFVSGDFTNVGSSQAAIDAFNNAGGYFGVEANETTRFEFGASLNAYAKFNLMENISFENILNLYSNYLDEPQNVDVDYTANIVMSVNKWITANVAFQAIYDDNAVKAFQIREGLGIGLTYGF
ncbi:MAG TPA: DUF3078 domain-containing protein [Flavobacteriaceae bacterium]|nr:DUF3078 domain-containing protein [Flavobacteriaceae bacterium]MCB9212714.1 DUF3078 domain-containing protein [Alteromonas sp.]HPF11771.1 DUF3078 domain-containing protein [Flavobacteriaceae bacterium]HQU20797.1 DUF3078 domain-containing protein [Flavobacteriaceae bacterium]HQU64972.1 DUF3078 domain-containing protein [Flavobacteriaceae bacterium]